MSNEITTAMVEQYKSNVVLLSQQMGSRLRKAVRVETVVGESAYFEQIDATAAIKKTSRHQDTPQIDTPHRRRRVDMEDYIWADYADKEDVLRILIEPTGAYALNAVAAFGRSQDDEILRAALGVAYTGKKGEIAVSLPGPQIILDGGEGLTIDKLIAARQIFWDNDVDDGIKLWMAVTGSQLGNLLGTVEVTSADYNTVKALVKGEVNEFMGFEFIRTNRVAKSGAVRQCVAWAEDGVCVGLGQDINTKVSERADKNYLTQVWCGMTIGATRLEEAKVVRVDCDETPA